MGHPHLPTVISDKHLCPRPSDSDESQTERGSTWIRLDVPHVSAVMTQTHIVTFDRAQTVRFANRMDVGDSAQLPGSTGGFEVNYPPWLPGPARR